MLAIFTLQENSALAATRTKADHPAPGLTSLQRSRPGHLRLRAFHFRTYAPAVRQTSRPHLSNNSLMIATP
jgi:hypothetical protein